MSEEYIPDHLKKRVSAELRDGELISWLGMPIPHCFDLKTSVMFVFGIIWTAFTVLWIFGQTMQETTTISFIVGIPFLLIGLALLSAPIWSYSEALKTVYVITNRRAFTLVVGSSNNIQSCDADIIQDAYCKEHREGIGDVIISPRAVQGDQSSGNSPYGFRHLENPREIERKLRDLASNISVE